MHRVQTGRLNKICPGHILHFSKFNLIDTTSVFMILLEYVARTCWAKKGRQKMLLLCCLSIDSSLRWKNYCLGAGSIDFFADVRSA